MKKGTKIAIAVGATLAVATVGILVFRRMTKGSEAAREYLDDVDANGGNAPRVDKKVTMRPVKAVTMKDALSVV